MPYIGNTVQTQGFAPAIDYFSGNGVTVTFTLSRPVLSVAQLTVAVDNVIQNPSSAFNVSGNSITFTSAPLSGTNNIWVEYTSLITTYAAISQDPSVIGDITATGGFLAEGDFGNTYIDGTIVDYVTGNARITTGPIDDMTFYHGGTASRSEMLRLSYAGNSYIVGNFGVGGVTPANTLEVYNGSNTQVRVRNGALATQSYDFGRNGSTGLMNFYGNQTGFTGYVFGGVDGTRMTIDSSGRVTTPYQPMFSAYLGTNMTGISAQNLILLNTTEFNVGSCFNTSTYRFTAPVAGYYLFTGVVQAAAVNQTHVNFFKNGSDYLDGWIDFGNTTGATQSRILSLAAGDYVQLYTYLTVSTTVYNGRTRMTGTLLG